jgi:hypothetical protein
VEVSEGKCSSEDSTGWYVGLKIRRRLKSKVNPCAENRRHGSKRESVLSSTRKSYRNEVRKETESTPDFEKC